MQKILFALAICLLAWSILSESSAESPQEPVERGVSQMSEVEQEFEWFKAHMIDEGHAKEDQLSTVSLALFAIDASAPEGFYETLVALPVETHESTVIRLNLKLTEMWRARNGLQVEFITWEQFRTQSIDKGGYSPLSAAEYWSAFEDVRPQGQFADLISQPLPQVAEKSNATTAVTIEESVDQVADVSTDKTDQLAGMTEEQAAVLMTQLAAMRSDITSLGEMLEEREAADVDAMSGDSNASTLDEGESQDQSQTKQAVVEVNRVFSDKSAFNALMTAYEEKYMANRQAVLARALAETVVRSVHSEEDLESFSEALERDSPWEYLVTIFAQKNNLRVHYEVPSNWPQLWITDPNGYIYWSDFMIAGTRKGRTGLKSLTIVDIERAVAMAAAAQQAEEEEILSEVMEEPEVELAEGSS